MTAFQNGDRVEIIGGGHKGAFGTIDDINRTYPIIRVDGGQMISKCRSDLRLSSRVITADPEMDRPMQMDVVEVAPDGSLREARDEDDFSQPDNSDTILAAIEQAASGTFDPAKAKPLPDADLKAAATALENDYWVCGDAKIRAQRVLRIIERTAHRGLTSGLIDRLNELVDEAGPADCRRVLEQHPDEVPF